MSKDLEQMDIAHRRKGKKMSKRLIYAEDAIDCCRNEWEEEVAERIEALPSVQPQDIARDIATIIENEKDMRVMLQPQWIPVTERLPKEGQNCLVCIDGVIGIDVYLGHGGAYDWECRVSHYDAWMPLPEAYKGGQE